MANQIPKFYKFNNWVSQKGLSDVDSANFFKKSRVQTEQALVANPENSLVWSLQHGLSSELTELNFNFYLPYVNEDRKYQFKLTLNTKSFENDLKAMGWSYELSQGTHLYKLRRLTCRMSDYLRYATIMFPLMYAPSAFLIPNYLLSAVAVSTLNNPFHPDWRQCAVLGEYVVSKLLFNEKADTFSLVYANGSTRTVPASQLRPALDSHDSITSMNTELRDTMNDMYGSNFNYLWIDDGEDHDNTLHLNYYNYLRNKTNFVDQLNENKDNYEYLQEVQGILAKFPWNGDKEKAEKEISEAKKNFALNKAFLVESEIKTLIEQHFSLHFNGSVVDLVLNEVAGGDLSTLKTQFDLDDKKFNELKANCSSQAVEWTAELRELLKDGKSLNLASERTVELLVGLSMHQLNGNTVDLPKLSNKSPVYSYIASKTKSQILETVPADLKVVHTNLLAFPSNGKSFDQKVLDRIAQNKMSFDEYRTKYMLKWI